MPSCRQSSRVGTKAIPGFKPAKPLFGYTLTSHLPMPRSVPRCRFRDEGAEEDGSGMARFQHINNT